MSESEKTLQDVREQRALSEESKKAHIEKRLDETGEREALREYVKQKLQDCGWNDEMKRLTKDLVQERGMKNLSVHEIVQELIPQARSKIPDDVKGETLSRIRTFVEHES